MTVRAPDAAARPSPGLPSSLARSPGVSAARVQAALGIALFTYENEVGLHAAIGAALDAAGIGYGREVRLDQRSRIDFLVDGGVGLEVKVAGSAHVVTRQLLRYAHSPRIQELVLVTTVASHRAVPRVLRGRPVVVHSLIGQSL